MLFRRPIAGLRSFLALPFSVVGSPSLFIIAELRAMLMAAADDGPFLGLISGGLQASCRIGR
ncbi:MAG: hypothetical protein ABIP62_11980, partial [Vicinamibacteria bacterium]